LLTPKAQLLNCRREFTSHLGFQIANLSYMSRWRRQPKKGKRRPLFGISQRPEDHTVSSIVINDMNVTSVDRPSVA